MKLIDNNLAIIEMKKVKVKMNKPIYFGLSILDISKITMYEFWYNYVKIKYQDRARLCYMDTDSFVVNIKTKDFLAKMLIKGLILQIILLIGSYRQELTKK